MIRWGRGTWHTWRQRSRTEQAEVSSRWMLKATPWIFFFGGAPQMLVAVQDGAARAWLALGVIGLGLVLCVLSARGLDSALTYYLERDERAPVRLLAVMAVASGAAVGLLAGVIALGGLRDGPFAGLALFALVPGPVGLYALLVPVRRALAVLLGCCAALGALFALCGMPPANLSAVLFIGVVITACSVFTPRSTGWYIAVVRGLDEAKQTQARLAVAEERLRFSRDLHDVMGRNLSAIALKSELATQLARRGSASAVDQMVEVQRLARQSQNEVREVVRGYREVGLATELAGARGILRAAGVDCRVEASPALDGIPHEVRTALGWVVREGATNVLRHADATRCAVRACTEPDGGTGAAEGVRAAVLVMENDGLRGAPGRPGTGLPGLRERLASLGGTLSAERVRGHGGTDEPDLFRLHARIPLTGADDRVAGAGGGPDRDDGSPADGGDGDGNPAGDDGGSPAGAEGGPERGDGGSPSGADDGPGRGDGGGPPGAGGGPVRGGIGEVGAGGRVRAGAEDGRSGGPEAGGAG